MSKVSVILSLTAEGSLAVELPGPFGASRIIPLRESTSANPTETLKRILTSLAIGQTKLGSDGAPTSAQVKHWERHGTFADSKCPFCQAEAAGIRASEVDELLPRYSHKRDARYSERSLGSGVTVKRIKSGLTAESQAKAAKTKAEREASWTKRWYKPSKARSLADLGF